MTKRILITGAGGFVGTHLIKALQQDGQSEIFAAVYKSTSDVSSLLPADHIMAGDLGDYAFAENLVRTTRPDLIYHLAALSVVHNSSDRATAVINGNTNISYNLLEATRLIAPTARFIAISSGNIYGAVVDASSPIKETSPLRPLNPYAVSKITQEMLALEYYLAYGLDVVILRPFNHTGIGQTTDFVIPRLVEQFARIEKGLIPPVLEVGNTDTIRDFTDVSDMVSAYILAAKVGASGEVYNIGSGVGHPISEVISLIQSLSTAKVEIKVSPALTRPSDVKVLVADATKFKSLTGWEPKIALSTTISDILEYWRKK